jgi:hypothetical protein
MRFKRELDRAAIMGGGKSFSIRCQCTVDCQGCGPSASSLISPSSRSLLPPLLLRSTKAIDRVNHSRKG